MRQALISAAVLGVLGVATSAGAAVLVEYNFGGAAPQTVAPNMAASNVAPTNLAVFNSFATSATYGSGNPFLQTAPNFGSQGDPAGAYARNEYWSLTLTPDVGYFLDLDTLDFTVFRGGPSGIRGFAVYSSLDAFATPLLVVNNEAGTRAAPRAESIALSGGFDNVTTPVTFRFYIHSVNNASSVDFDNVRFTGSVAVIPEPAALGMLMLPAAMLLRRR
ncbi:MAG: hypothetical protein ACK4PI_11440 [Tepidisphaerales bacterium]